MKIVSFLCSFDDCEYLDQTIESFKHFPDKLFIIEGSWKSSQAFKNSKPRSGKETYDIINRHVDNERVFLVTANEARERNQRQIGLNLAKQERADWCWMLDSDEVYTRDKLEAMRRILAKSEGQVYGYRVRSYNFINSFSKWYDGNYMRIYKPTPQAEFIMDNDVNFRDILRWVPKIETMPESLRFHHYNYVKQNSEQFWRKMHYQAEQDPSFNQRLLPQYGCEQGKYKIPSDIPIYDYVGKHPRIMKEHPYFKANIYGDKDLQYQNK